MRRGRYPAPSQVECQPWLLPQEAQHIARRVKGFDLAGDVPVRICGASLARVHCATIYSLSMLNSNSAADSCSTMAALTETWCTGSFNSCSKLVRAAAFLVWAVTR
jgi:hypothetical protein